MIYTIIKPSGLKLNQQRTDFNVRDIHFATFKTKKEAEDWIKENNKNFLGIVSKTPLKLKVIQVSLEKSTTE